MTGGHAQVNFWNTKVDCIAHGPNLLVLKKNNGSLLNIVELASVEGVLHNGFDQNLDFKKKKKTHYNI